MPMTINDSNIMWRDISGVVRKWIDQQTGDVMEHDCERLSLCCGAGANEYIEEFCNGCSEYAEFECVECTEEFGIAKESRGK